MSWPTNLSASARPRWLLLMRRSVASPPASRISKTGAPWPTNPAMWKMAWSRTPLTSLTFDDAQRDDRVRMAVHHRHDVGALAVDFAVDEALKIDLAPACVHG